jgi:hypothetical protein
MRNTNQKKEGVKIYILLWNETKALNLNSAKTEEKLEKMHENIMVIRHPIIHPIKWSHHQKTLIVDQQIAVNIS